jgi:hypothetical protein
MGANFPRLLPKPSIASKKADERSEFRVAFDLAFAFSQSHENIDQKIAPRAIF